MATSHGKQDKLRHKPYHVQKLTVCISSEVNLQGLQLRFDRLAIYDFHVVKARCLGYAGIGDLLSLIQMSES